MRRCEPGKLKQPVGRPPDQVSRNMDSMAILGQIAARLDWVLQNDRDAELLYLSEIENLKTLRTELGGRPRVILRGIIDRLQRAYHQDLQDDSEERQALEQAKVHLDALRHWNAKREGVLLDEIQD